MAKTAAKQKTRQQNTTANETQSLQVLKNMLRTSISTITYMRHLLPESCYELKSYADMEVRSCWNAGLRWPFRWLMTILTHHLLHLLSDRSGNCMVHLARA